ncbi:MAG: DUF3616 domain-containing protein, partial [Anaerolineae bacterium]|nr:DUF3616 domain-containing protein [Anaerolineae bacterium]
ASARPSWAPEWRRFAPPTPGTEQNVAGGTPTPEDPAGFNIEGLAFPPGSSTTAYLGFRAPIISGNALIVPVTNFNALPGGAGPASFGAPLLLDLGGRGIRSLDCNGTECVILAGPAGGAGSFALYSWTGNAGDAPILRSTDLSGIAATGSPEGLIIPAGALTDTSPVQLISDIGDYNAYGTGAIGDITNVFLRKFRSDVVPLGMPGTILPVACATFTPIYTIQGSVDAIALTGAQTTVGVVTAAFPAAPSAPFPNDYPQGFFIQDRTGDGDADTSDGIFIYDPNEKLQAAGLGVGDVVAVIGGTASDFEGQSQLSIAGGTGSVVDCTVDGTVTPTVIELPYQSLTDAAGQRNPEDYEGMLVTFDYPLYVTEQYELGRHGEIQATRAWNFGGFSGTRLFNPTNLLDPQDDAAARAALQDFNDRNRVALDNGDLDQNVPLAALSFFLRPNTPLAPGSTSREGDQLEDVVGVMSFSDSRTQNTATPPEWAPPLPGPPDAGANYHAPESPPQRAGACRR